MERWAGKTAIVTGASSGIGAAIAVSLVNHGMNVVGLARRMDKLQEIEKDTDGKEGKFYPIKCDVSKEEEILCAFNWVEENLNGVHVLINNAGTVMNLTPLEGTETDVWRTLYNINILGLQICSREAVKAMRLHEFDGHIINISSIAAHMSSVLPGMSSYFASKKAVNTLSEGLRVELGATKSKIKVTTISPGLVTTEIFDRAGVNIPDTVPSLKSEDIAASVEFALQLPANVLITEMVIRDVIDSTEGLITAFSS